MHLLTEWPLSALCLLSAFLVPSDFQVTHSSIGREEGEGKAGRRLVCTAALGMGHAAAPFNLCAKMPSSLTWREDKQGNEEGEPPSSVVSGCSQRPLWSTRLTVDPSPISMMLSSSYCRVWEQTGKTKERFFNIFSHHSTLRSCRLELCLWW